MNKKKLMGYILTGVLSLGVVGGVGTAAFAATTDATVATSAKTEVGTKAKQQLDAATQKKVDTIVAKLKTDLNKLGVTLPTKGDKSAWLANLDAATKTKAQAILDQQEAGTITKEEAKTKLAALGVDVPTRGGKGGHQDWLANLDDATKAKAQAILDKKEAGTITREEAKTQLTALGVDMPDRSGKQDWLASLDTATKEKAQSILDQKKAGTITKEEAKTQLADLGVTMPDRGDHDGKRDWLANQDLDAATKEKAQALIDGAKAELEKLGVNHLPLH